MSSFDRLSFKSIFDNFLHRTNFLKKYPKIDVLGPDRGKITIYGSNFQQVKLTPNGGVSSTDKLYHFYHILDYFQKTWLKIYVGLFLYLFITVKINSTGI